MQQEKGNAPARAIAEAQEERGKEYKNPSQTVYHENNDSSIPYEEYFPKYLGMGFKEKNCARCGKVFIPTRPEYAWGDCCSYTCSLRYEEQRQEALKNAREVVLLNPDTREDVTIFESVRAAADFANVTPKDIRNACNGLSEKSGGYGWRWADEEPISKSDVVKRYAPEKMSKMSIVIRSSAYERIERIAEKRGISKNKAAVEILEKELSKKEYEL